MKTNTRIAKPAGPRAVHWAARCACGTEQIVPGGNLSHGLSTQCATCGHKAVVASQRRRAKERRAQMEMESLENGIPIRGWRGSIPLFECPHGTLSATGRCRHCEHGSYKYPETLQSAADRIGVTKQRVHQVVKERGWDGMLAYFAERMGVPA